MDLAENSLNSHIMGLSENQALLTGNANYAVEEMKQIQSQSATFSMYF